MIVIVKIKAVNIVIKIIAANIIIKMPHYINSNSNNSNSNKIIKKGLAETIEAIIIIIIIIVIVIIIVIKVMQKLRGFLISNGDKFYKPLYLYLIIGFYIYDILL